MISPQMSGALSRSAAYKRSSVHLGSAVQQGNVRAIDRKRGRIVERGHFVRPRIVGLGSAIVSHDSPNERIFPCRAHGSLLEDVAKQPGIAEIDGFVGTQARAARES
jgi:hypothetical protein